MRNKLAFFTRGDFKPHPQDASIPLMQRLEGHSFSGITLGRSSILIDQVKITRGQVNIQALERIDSPLNEESRVLVTEILQKADLNKAIVSMAYGSCPLREPNTPKMDDLEILKTLRQKPKSIIKDNHDTALLYSVLTAKDSPQSLIFSARQADIQHVENLLSAVQICRLTQSMYSGLFYLSRFAEISEGITLLLDFNSVLCLKVEKAQWLACSYRCFEVADEAIKAIEEMLAYLSPYKEYTIHSINNVADIDLTQVLEPYTHRPLLERFPRPLLFAACHG